MARPLKEGLDYFPFNVDFFNDEKLQFVSSRFDEKGELIAVKLLCKIYNNGYFIKWNEDVSLLFSKVAGKNISNNLANDVVNELIKREFFDKTLFERFGILTSRGIQKRYIKACKDSSRKCTIIEPKFNLIELTTEETQLTTEETQLTTEESTQSKVKKSKVKKSNNTPPKFSQIFKSATLEDFENEVHLVVESDSKCEMPDNEIEKFIAHWTSENTKGIMKFKDSSGCDIKAKIRTWKNQSYYGGNKAIAPNKVQTHSYENGEYDPYKDVCY